MYVLTPSTCKNVICGSKTTTEGKKSAWHGVGDKYFGTCVVFGLFFALLDYVRTKDPFDTLLHTYRGMLYSLCRRYARRGLEADDLLQDVTVALWQQRSRLADVPEGVQRAAWVWRVARNAAIDTMRRTPQTEALPEGLDPAEEDRTALEHLRERIALLPEPDHTIVGMQLQGYSYEEIAAATGMTVKNVSVRLVRIKEKIRKEWT